MGSLLGGPPPGGAFPELSGGYGSCSVSLSPYVPHPQPHQPWLLHVSLSVLPTPLRSSTPPGTYVLTWILSRWEQEAPREFLNTSTTTPATTTTNNT